MVAGRSNGVSDSLPQAPEKLGWPMALRFGSHPGAIASLGGVCVLREGGRGDGEGGCSKKRCAEGADRHGVLLVCFRLLGAVCSLCRR
jgi:hypothetical protein